jgi:hypothetical protein
VLVIVTTNYMQVRENIEQEKRQEGDTEPKQLSKVIVFIEMTSLKAPMPIPKKAFTKASSVELEVLEVEETPRVSSSSKPRFPHDYIPPRKDDAPPMTLPKNVNHTLVTPKKLKGVIIDEDILGKVPKLRYVYHDIKDTMKFVELVPHLYLEMKVDPTTNQSRLVHQVWARGLECIGLLNLVYITHFGQRKEVNACVKFLLYCVCGGYLWLDRPISINISLTARIKILLTQGEDPNLLFFDKKSDMDLSEAMR